MKHINMADKLLHGEEEVVWADAGYQGIEMREEHQARRVGWCIAMRPGKRAALPKRSPLHKIEKTKASIRAKVEHAFQRIKQMFGYAKVRYRGLAKNKSRLYLLAGFANLLRAEPYMPA